MNKGLNDIIIKLLTMYDMNHQHITNNINRIINNNILINNRYKTTYLIWECEKSMESVALNIINKCDTRYNINDNINYYNYANKNNNTALIIACKNGLFDVAMKLLNIQGIDY